MFCSGFCKFKRGFIYDHVFDLAYTSMVYTSIYIYLSYQELLIYLNLGFLDYLYNLVQVQKFFLKYLYSDYYVILLKFYHL